MKKLTTILLALILVIGLIPASVLSVSADLSGAEGEISWTFASDAGVLTVTGAGAIPNYFCLCNQSLSERADQIRGVVIGEGVTEIGRSAFGELPNLSSVTLPDSLRVIGSSAFWGCGGLTELSLPEGLLSIGESAFQNCGLRRITIPASVTQIEDSAFFNCQSLEGITVAAGSSAYSSDGRGVLYNKAKTTLIQAPALLSGSYALPGTVRTSASYAFYGCAGLTAVTLPASLEATADCMFYDCVSLTQVDLAEGLREIGYFSFCGCASLRELRIPASVQEIGFSAFEGCTSMERYIVDAENPVYASDAAGAIYNKAGTELLLLPAAYSGAYTVQDGVVSIYFDALQDCRLLTALELPASLEMQDHVAAFFYDCRSLARITVSPANPYYADQQGILYNKDLSELIRCPNAWAGRCEVVPGCRVIQDGAFSGCVNLTEAVLPDGLETIGSGAYHNCTALKTIWIPASVTGIELFSIGFYDCPLERRGGGALRVRGLAIYGYPGTAAQAYADEFNFDFYDLSQYEEGKTEFDDVSPDAWYARPVHWAVSRGIVSGTGAGCYSPKKTCSRAEIVTMLWRAMGSPEPETVESDFVDVSPDAWYAKAVCWAVEAGITSGTTPTTFSPKQACTRAQAVTFLWKAISPGESGDAPENPFTDVKDGAWYAAPVLWAVQHGITSGTTATTFSPNRPCTRSQVVTFLWQAKESYYSSFCKPE